MNNIKNIVFDMGGVLVDLERQACVNAFVDLGFKDAPAMLDPYLQRGIFLQHESGEITPQQFRDAIKQGVEDPVPSDEQIDEALNKFLIGLPVYKLEMLRDLKKRFKIYMLSNTNQIMVDFIDRTMFTQEGLTYNDYFDYRYLSHEMKLLKPSDDIYLEMARHGEMIPEQTLFLDDSQANIETAVRLGFQTYFVKPEEDYRHIFSTI